jgi:ferredoxin-like protein FixX
VSAIRADGTFIAVEVDETVARDPELAAKLAEVCPVDIYARDDDGALEIVERNLDECVLCRLCLDAAGGRDPIPVRVIKLYDNDAVLA